MYFCRYCNFRTGSIATLKSHRCAQHSDLLRNYAAAAVSSNSQSGLKGFRYAGCSQAQAGQVNEPGAKGPALANEALNLVLSKPDDADLVGKEELVSHKCPYCTHTSYYPEALWVHQQIEHKVNASCPMAPKWAVGGSHGKSGKSGFLPLRRTGPPPFLEGKDCPALTAQKGARPQEAAAHRGRASGSSRSKPKDSGTSDRTQKAGLTKDRPKQTEGGANASGAKPPPFPRGSQRTCSPDRHRVAACGLPQEGLGFVLARQPGATPPEARPQPPRHSLDSPSSPKNLNLWTALNMLTQSSYSDPAHGAPGKAESGGGEKQGDINILGLLRGHAPHDLTSLCQQWSFIDPKTEPKGERRRLSRVQIRLDYRLRLLARLL